MVFHQFNPFSGRLSETKNFRPLYPLSPIPLQSQDPPVMFYDSVKTRPATVSTQAAGEPKVCPKIRENQIKFQQNIHEPVFLKGGRRDIIIFGFICVATVIQTVRTLKEIRKLM